MTDCYRGTCACDGCKPPDDDSNSLLCRARDACREVRSWSGRSAVRAWTPHDGQMERLLVAECSAVVDDGGGGDDEQDSGGRSGSIADALVYVANRARLVLAHVVLLAAFVIGALVVPVRSTAFLVRRLNAVRRVHDAQRCRPHREHPDAMSAVGYVWTEFLVHAVFVVAVNLVVLFLVYAPVYHVLYRVLGAVLRLLDIVLAPFRCGTMAAAAFL